MRIAQTGPALQVRNLRKTYGDVVAVDGEPWAAVSIDDGHVVADPFRPASELVLMLSDRARRIRRAEHGTMQRLPRVWPAWPDAH